MEEDGGTRERRTVIAQMKKDWMLASGNQVPANLDIANQLPA